MGALKVIFELINDANNGVNFITVQKYSSLCLWTTNSAFQLFTDEKISSRIWSEQLHSTKVMDTWFIWQWICLTQFMDREPASEHLHHTLSLVIEILKKESLDNFG